ncbi:MAG: hypothetical protein R6U96_04540 [Promethearchaeia archaeon]
MKEKIQLEISKENNRRLTAISQFLDLPLSHLAELAFQELFLMIQDDTDIFLKEIGFYEKLHKQIT